jgi:hypothetical protein
VATRTSRRRSVSVNADDATILKLLAESLRSRVMTDRSMDLYAAVCDRIAGTGTGVAALRSAVAKSRTNFGPYHDEEAGP